MTDNLIFDSNKKIFSGSIDTDINAVFTPYIEKSFDPLDSRWKNLVKDSKMFWMKKYYKRLLLSCFGMHGRRSQKNIEQDYSSQWKNTPLKNNIDNTKSIPCLWGEKFFLARSYGLKRVHQFLLAKFIERTKPKNILEVGSGNGLNLFILSYLFPSIKLTGVELTEGGIDAAKKISLKDNLPDYIVKYSPLVGEKSNAHNCIDFIHGSAQNLCFKNESFDLVFTILALEQMEEIRHKALSEISRVCKKYLVMVEPFRDWNNNSTNRHRVKSLDYFSANINDLQMYGFRVLGCFDNIPNKLHYTTNFLVAEKVNKT